MNEYKNLDLKSVRYGTKRVISILGSTGSIGCQTLEVISQNPELYSLRSISCDKNIVKLLEQIHQYKPEIVCVYDKEAADLLRPDLPDDVYMVVGMDGMRAIARDTDMDVLVTSVVGNIGLIPTIDAVERGKRIALANKETMVTAGKIIMELADKHGAEIIPIDSEHSAIFQCLQSGNHREVESIILTASGGPFRGKVRPQLQRVKAHEALKHPNWSMGQKITIDSATLMNKGLEVIEARWLFDISEENIQVVVHPESIIHSMVQFYDSSVIAQLGFPDMRLPIHYALGYPARIPIGLERMDFTKIGRLNFEEPDYNTFPCLGLAFEALHQGGTMPTVMNAANEIMVGKFLEDKAGFYDIPSSIEIEMMRHNVIKEPSISDIIEVDREIRERLSRL